VKTYDFYTVDTAMYFREFISTGCITCWFNMSSNG